MGLYALVLRCGTALWQSSCDTYTECSRRPHLQDASLNVVQLDTRVEPQHVTRVIVNPRLNMPMFAGGPC
jgi:hypothetical protein